MQSIFRTSFACIGLLSSAVFAEMSPARALVEKQAEAVGVSIVKEFKQAETGLAGFVLVTKNGDPLIVYADTAGRYMFSGAVIDPSSKNLSIRDAQEHMPKPSHEAAYLAAEKANWIATGDVGAPKVMYVFADPLCSWCKKEWSELSTVKNVEVRWIMFGLSETSENKAAQILTAKNPAVALAQAFENGIYPDSADNAAQVKIRENKNAAAKARVSGTPSIVFKDKTNTYQFIPGALLGAKIAATIERISER